LCTGLLAFGKMAGLWFRLVRETETPSNVIFCTHDG
jgi:hypothetical protein